MADYVREWFKQMVAVGLPQARMGENLFEWDRGQTHLPEQMKNEHADLLLPGLVYFKGCLRVASFGLREAQIWKVPAQNRQMWGDDFIGP